MNLITWPRLLNAGTWLRLVVQRLPWLMPLFSFASGWLGFALVQRGENLAQWVALFALLGWPWLLLEPLIVRWGARLLKRPLPPILLNMVTQSLQQEVLFFALPFLFGVTQRDPGQMLFTGLAAAAALVSTLDIVYERHISHRPWLSLLFHSYCSFIAGLVVLPIAAHLPIERALPVAMAITGLWLLLSLPRMIGSLQSLRARLFCFAAIVIGPLLAVGLRNHIPAAGLWVNEARVSQSIESLTPGPEVKSLGVEQLLAEGAVAYVAIRAPTGLAQAVIFEWSHEGQVVDRIPAEILGTGHSGWRTFSRKHVFPPDPRGHWTVDLRTPFGQLICRMRFEVV